jgi:putative MATE family efflux protein
MKGLQIFSGKRQSATVMSSKTEMNLTEGNIQKKMFIFAIPILISGWLQLSFNLADYIMCGQLIGNSAVASIGDTGSLISLMVDLAIGLGIGVNVSMGKAYGALDKEEGSRILGSGFLLALIVGLLLAVVGISSSRYLLQAMNTHANLIDNSDAYMKIYFAGFPFLLIYNFLSSGMRGMGDTQKPFIYLSVGGVLNVFLNWLFVSPLQMGVSGLAWATSISEAFSALLVIIDLARNRSGFASLSWSKLRLYPKSTKEILRIGIPAGIQGAMYDIANVIITFQINAFSDSVIAGDSAAAHVSSFIYVASDSFVEAGVAFVSANYGAKKVDNIRKSIRWSYFFAAMASLIMGWLVVIFRQPLLSMIINSNTVEEGIDPAQALATGELNIWICCSTHVFMALVDVIGQDNRGLGYSIMPTLVSLIGICVLRLVYIFGIYLQVPGLNQNIGYLYMVYPISWCITAICHFVSYLIVRKKAYRACLQQDQTTSGKTAEAEIQQ